jgi:hypothetical protein
MSPIKMLYFIIGMLLFCFAMMALIVATAKPAASHASYNAATGQTQWYDASCCSSRDCEPVPPEAVEDMATGWHVSYISSRGFAMKALVPHGEERHSQDGRFHACAVEGRFYCLYVPSTV